MYPHPAHWPALHDGNPCTSGDECSASNQCAGTAISADDGNPCTSDSCNPVTGPVHTGTARSDGSSCTTGEACNASGVCVGTLGTTCGSVATFFCYKYGNTSKKIVCLPNQSCPLFSP